MWFRHLDYPPDTPATALGPAALEALIERGDLEAWAPLLRAIASDPWGETAEAVLRICGAHYMYGTSVLFRAWIEACRSAPVPGARTLAQTRAAAGLTQTEVAARLGVAQSDVSKLERRSDIRLSTLRAYARALGGELRMSIRLPGEEEGREVTVGEG